MKYKKTKFLLSFSLIFGGVVTSTIAATTLTSCASKSMSEVEKQIYTALERNLLDFIDPISVKLMTVSYKISYLDGNRVLSISANNSYGVKVINNYRLDEYTLIKYDGDIAKVYLDDSIDIGKINRRLDGYKKQKGYL